MKVVLRLVELLIAVGLVLRVGLRTTLGLQGREILVLVMGLLEVSDRLILFWTVEVTDRAMEWRQVPVMAQEVVIKRQI